MTKTLAQAYLDVSLTLPMEDIKVKQRLDRAYGILEGYGYHIFKQVEAQQAILDDTMPYTIPATYTINKASTTLLEDTSATYVVSNQHCTCPDHDSARGNLCKHRLAIMLLENMRSGDSATMEDMAHE